MKIRSLTLNLNLPIPAKGTIALRGQLVEHAALTFLGQLRKQYPEQFRHWRAIELLQGLFEKRRFAPEQTAQLQEIIQLLYQHYPGFRYFHNHRSGEIAYDFGYPLIHYRIRKRRPQLIAFGESIPTVKQWMMQAHPRSWLNLGRVRFEEHIQSLELTNTPIYYRLLDWNAFNSDNYRRWKDAPLMRDRLDIMEQALTGQLRSIVEHFLGIEKPSITAELVLLKNIRPEKTFRHTDLIANILFRSPILLPQNMAIGRSISIGYGTQKQMQWQGEAYRKEGKKTKPPKHNIPPDFKVKNSTQ